MENKDSTAETGDAKDGAMLLTGRTALQERRCTEYDKTASNCSQIGLGYCSRAHDGNALVTGGWETQAFQRHVTAKDDQLRRPAT